MANYTLCEYQNSLNIIVGGYYVACMQRAIKNFPELVMAGACLPDLAIVSHHYRKTHLWKHGHQLMQSACTEEETVIAIGYISHLYVDVIAHNNFCTCT